MAKRTLQQQVDYLDGEVGMLREVINLMITNCPCTAQERYSGHLVDCPIPKIREILDEPSASADPVYRDPTE